MALTVTRQSAGGSGMVYVTASSVDSPAARTAGTDGFEVVSP